MKLPLLRFCYVFHLYKYDSFLVLKSMKYISIENTANNDQILTSQARAVILILLTHWRVLLFCANLFK